MHGLVNRTIQRFMTDTYGADCWAKVAVDAELGFDGFEAMLIYEDELTGDVLNAACDRLDKRTHV